MTPDMQFADVMMKIFAFGILAPMLLVLWGLLFALALMATASIADLSREAWRRLKGRDRK